MANKSYYYVFVANVTDVDKNLKDAFDNFEKLYARETAVDWFYPRDDGFREGLTGFGIKKAPGFAVSDVLYDVKPGFKPNPFISVDRAFLEGRNRDDLFNLIRDWHEVVLTENILRIGRDKVLEQATRLFGKAWEEIKETIEVVAPLVP